MKTTQGQISVPDYKKELLLYLQQRLKRQAIMEVAARSSYSYQYTRAWFKSAMVNSSIKDAAFQLLKELVEAEKAEAQQLKKVVS